MTYLKIFYQLILAIPSILKLIKTITEEAKAANAEMVIKEKFKGLDESIKIKDKNEAAKRFNSIFNS